jgi:hypothetical protein
MVMNPSELELSIARRTVEAWWADLQSRLFRPTKSLSILSSVGLGIAASVIVLRLTGSVPAAVAAFLFTALPAGAAVVWLDSRRLRPQWRVLGWARFGLARLGGEEPDAVFVNGFRTIYESSQTASSTSRELFTPPASGQGATGAWPTASKQVVAVGLDPSYRLALECIAAVIAAHGALEQGGPWRDVLHDGYGLIGQQAPSEPGTASLQRRLLGALLLYVIVAIAIIILTVVLTPSSSQSGRSEDEYDLTCGPCPSGRGFYALDGDFPLNC